jgi:hypothetical protein
MDEKGAMMGVIGQQRCIISKSEKRPKSLQDGNREWVTLIECISLLGTVLSPYIIFKGKTQLKKWHTKMKELRGNEPYEIGLSETGWTDNELGLNWLMKTFHPETSKIQKGEYRLLLWDGHSSHISTEAIKFCIQNKIVPLCLPPHTTHLLQPCDVGVFGPEATLYKNAIARRSRPGSAHNIDKIDFLEVYNEIRPQALSKSNIQRAWQEVGLLPFDPYIVLSKIRPQAKALPSGEPNVSRPSTSQGTSHLSELTTPSLVVPLQLSKTPYNVTGVTALLDKIKDGKVDTMVGLEKLAKVAEFSLAKVIVVETQNQDLVDAGKEAQKKKHQESGDLGKARVMGQEALEVRITSYLEKWWKKPFGFGRIQDDVFTWEITSQRIRTPKKKGTYKPLIHSLI